MAEIRGKRTFWLIAFAAAIKAFIGYGAAAFLAPFFFRNHAAELTVIAGDFGLGLTGFLGVALGIVLGLTGALGTWMGGQLADKYGASLYPFILDNVVGKPDLMLGDHIHPNAKGVKIVVEGLAPLVSDALPDAK